LQHLESFRIQNLEHLEKLVAMQDHCILEIGFGNGDNTLHLANENPNALIVASEVYRSGIGSLLSGITERKLQNIYIFDEDIRELLLAVNKPIFDQVFIICPDPWRKTRHHKRRLISQTFLETLHLNLKPKATVYLSTDWENYAESMEEEILKCSTIFSYEQITNAGMPITRFQARAMREGRDICTFLLTSLEEKFDRLV